MVDSDLPVYKVGALHGASFPMRLAISIAYWPVALGLVAFHYIRQPVLFTFEAYRRLFKYLDFHDADFLAMMSVVLTWWLPLTIIILVLTLPRQGI